MPPAVGDATLVHIAVKTNPLRLCVFPVRHGDTVAFSTKKHHNPSPERPHEVVWVGHDIPVNATIEIKVKATLPPNMQKLLPQPSYLLTKAADSVSSGTVPMDEQGVWSYGVRLIDAAGNDLCTPIDPDVIVKPDP